MMLSVPYYQEQTRTRTVFTDTQADEVLSLAREMRIRRLMGNKVGGQLAYNQMLSYHPTKVIEA